MGRTRLYEDLCAALSTLGKLVLSQPAGGLIPAKVQIRPVRMKGGLFYQVESFENNKAFHRNLSADELCAYFAAELDGRYRQALLVSEALCAQYSLNSKGGYKRKMQSGIPLPGAPESHNREKSYLLSEGEAIPALVDMGVFTADYRIAFEKAPVDMGAGKVTVYPRGGEAYSPDTDEGDCYYNEIRFFVESLQTGKENVNNPPESAATTIKLVNKLIESAEKAGATLPFEA